MTSKVLIIGSGGREHALAYKLSRSIHVAVVYVCPGIAACGQEDKLVNVDIPIDKNAAIVQWTLENSISLVVVGPEQPLANGLADDLKSVGIRCFGPSRAAAKLEWSKEFAKGFMLRHAIPTARWKSFTNADAAKQHVKDSSYTALVIKASGLAAGKGVVVAVSVDEACDAVDLIMCRNAFGDAGTTVVVEEKLEGDEISVLAFSDGDHFAIMPVAQDHKRLLNGDAGPNTGGMGAYCPYPHVNSSTMDYIREKIVEKTIAGMTEEGSPFVGVLYVGLMLTPNGPKVLEYNCRFGDPETEAILSLLKSDLYVTMESCVDGNLNSCLPQWDENNYAVGVVMVSRGYPATCERDQLVSGLDVVGSLPDVRVFHAATKISDGNFVTNGGRVLVVVAKAASLIDAAEKAQSAVKKISFNGAYYRTDIAARGILKHSSPRITYADAGVSIAEGERFVELISPLAQLTNRPGVVGSIGGFGGIFDLKAVNYKDPLLVSGTDGVGTKLKIANYLRKHKSIGIDLVAMCVNDILTHGAEPLFFLDYYACSKLDVSIARDVVEGIANGCRDANCCLLGGETAEMPSMYSGDDYDVAGFGVGVVERNNLLPRLGEIREGDVVIGLASAGLHSNGFSLVRKIVELSGYDLKSAAPFNPKASLGDELLKPTKIYVRSVLPLLQKNCVKAVSHITGGGLSGNLARVLTSKVKIVLDATTWPIPNVFGWIAQLGVSSEEMISTFNCGIGLALIVGESHSNDVVRSLSDAGEDARTIGVVSARGESDAVVVQNMDRALRASCAPIVFKEKPEKKKVAVLISGTGTNLQALIDYTKSVTGSSRVVLVISNIPDAFGLKRAEKENIPTRVINHKAYKTRLDFDMAVHQHLLSAGIEIVCLAGFMRILSGEFVRMWRGRLLNIHPSLLPSFPGLHVHRRVLESGVRVTGCTVHFVVEEVDAGGIIAQEAVEVKPLDTEEILAERVKCAEHRVYPRALNLLASGSVKLNENNAVEWN